MLDKITYTPTESSLARYEKSCALDRALTRLRDMTTTQLVNHAQRVYGLQLPKTNGPTWLRAKLGYIEKKEIYGTLTGRAAARAAALDKPETIKAYQDEEPELIARLRKTNNPKEGTMKKSAKKGKGKGKTAKQKKAALSGAPRGAKRTYPLGSKITIVTKTNPKRAGSASYDRFALYTKNKTVEKFLTAGGTTGDLMYDVKRGYIKIKKVAA